MLASNVARSGALIQSTQAMDVHSRPCSALGVDIGNAGVVYFHLATVAIHREVERVAPSKRARRSTQRYGRSVGFRYITSLGIAVWLRLSSAHEPADIQSAQA